MVSIRFPETNVVSCVFSYRTTNESGGYREYDEYDHRCQTDGRALKKYQYRVPEYLQGKLKIGDAVVVHCQTGFQICEVVGVNEISGFDINTMAPVVSKIDMSSWVAEIEKKKQLKAMKAEIDKEKKRLESMVTYELIAEKNPAFKAMLEAFKEAGGEF